MPSGLLEVDAQEALRRSYILVLSLQSLITPIMAVAELTKFAAWFTKPAAGRSKAYDVDDCADFLRLMQVNNYIFVFLIRDESCGKRVTFHLDEKQRVILKSPVEKAKEAQ
ncbi:hypothetical protein RRG08_032235 [Elysia crispata]|uniref:Uncharacterized protein n=1 Tax=Elysia crispata TaxID=231223 RepID=A0AAE1B136_9GAST|nr:hypothetical protein RRG08_032235 [Elysia crispata]